MRGHTIDDTSVLDLVRQQARTALLHFALIVGSIMGFLALIVIVPGLRTARPFDLPPLPWLVLGPVALFSTALVAFRHERRARHIEDRWSIDHRETSR